MLGIALATAAISFASAASKKPPECTNVTPNNFIIEFRPNYFYPLSSHFRTFFAGGIDYQLTASCPVYWGENDWIRGITVFVAGDYYSRTGHSSFPKDKTTISIVPVTLGLKYFFPALGNCVPVNLYLAAGMKYYFVHNRNKGKSIRHDINVNGMGGMVEAGAIAVLWKHLVLDLFVSGSFKSFSPPSISRPGVKGTSLNVSSINAGGGIGYKF